MKNLSTKNWFRSRILAVTLCSVVTTLQCKAATFTLTPPTGTYIVGQEFTITLIADSTGSNLVVADAVIEFDPSMVELVGFDTKFSDFNHNFQLSDATLLPVTEIDNNLGKGRIVVAVPTPGIAGSELNVASLTFRPLTTTEQTDINLNNDGTNTGSNSKLLIDDGSGTDALTAVNNARYTFVSSVDTDGDGIFDIDDNCPLNANSAQEDTDFDGEGDACDADRDGDGVPNDSDVFPDDRTEAADNDSDGIGDNADTDDDNDGFNDVEEGECGSDPKDAASTCANPDSDGDGVIDSLDNCPSDSNPDQLDSNGNGVGDACEVQAIKCDLDVDGDIDSNDITAILGLRNTTSPPSDARADVDDDGFINVIDARRCVLRCTLPRCEVR